MNKKFTLTNALLWLLALAPLCNGQEMEMLGTWSGVATAPSLWGGVELTLSRSADGWNANGRLQFQGRERSAPVSDLEVDGAKVSFNMNWENHRFRFNGQSELRAARLLTLEMTRNWVREFIQKAFDSHMESLLTGTAVAYREAQISMYE